MLTRHTVDTIASWDACWDHPGSGHAPVREVLAAQTDWSALELLDKCDTDDERIWVWTRPGVATERQMARWLADLVARTLDGVDADPRSLAVVGMLRRIADGETVPPRERDEIAWAASAARAASAAWAAWDAWAASAARAARDASAAWDASASWAARDASAASSASAGWAASSARDAWAASAASSASAAWAASSASSASAASAARDAELSRQVDMIRRILTEK